MADPTPALTAARSLVNPWDPRIIAAYNQNKVFVAYAKGEFPWHEHPETDDLFLVLEGELQIDLPDRTVTLAANDLFVVPKGTRHRPRSEHGARLLIIEPRDTPNTGDPTTAAPERWYLR